jgi:glycosyltransferase involved in cell wall biosynthesis
MENIKTVLISNFSLPFLGIGSWTSMINYHISNGCSIDYLICPKSEILVKKPKQYFIKPQNNFDKIKIQLLRGSKFNKYLHKLNEILFLEKYIIIQVIDNVGLMFAIIDFVQKRDKRKNVYLQFFYHGYQPFFKSELMCSKIDELVLLSKKSYENFKKKLNVLSIKVSVLNNGVNSSKFKLLSHYDKNNLKKRNQFQENTIYFVWCSQDRKKKGLEIILQAWEELLKVTTYKIELLIIGTNKVIDLKHVIVIGKVPNNELNKYLQISDFYLFSTLCQEGFGLSLVEALKCGNYCIASNMGAVSEVLNEGKYGKLIDCPHFVNSWVEAILESLDEYINNEQVNPYLKNIPSNLHDIVPWNNGLKNIIREAKNSFSKRYYL